ncbi:MAG: adenylate/guanylate cyclase domain-containing protein [Azospirillaceae bacterium]
MAGAVERKLTTIMAADAVGYSRLMEADEVATLDRLKAYRAAMVGLIERHRGRLVNTWGDAQLVEFASVVEAVQCAVEIQQELAARNADLPADRRLVFRIGVNLGDVMVEGDDLYGEGVNVAARLESLAEPGGILLSGPAYDQVRHKLGVRFAFLGERRVKNLAEPVPVWRLDLPGAPRVEAEPRPQAGAPAPDQGEEAAGSPSDDEATSPLDRLRARVPRPIAGLVGLTALLLVVNLITGPGDLWFYWPTIGIGLAVVVPRVFHARAARDRLVAAAVAIGLFVFIDLVTAGGLTWAHWPALAIGALAGAPLLFGRGGGRRG